MRENDSLRGRTRREYLAILGLGGAAGLAGCAGDDDGDGGDGTDGSDGNDGSDGSDDDDGDSDDGLPEVQGTFITGSATDARTMYHVGNADANTDDRISLILDGSYTLTDDREVFPLWLDIENTGDSQVYVCTLRDNLQWGAGYGQMTAEDWVYHIEEVHQGGWAGSQANWFVTVDNEQVPITVQETGDLEFQIELPRPNADFPFEPPMWGAYCLPRGLTEQYASEEDVEGLQQDEEIQTIAYGGNLGPYTWDTWDRESEFRAVRNDEYYMREVGGLPEEWSRAPYFEENVYRVIEEESTRLQALRQGEITSTGIPLDRVSEFEDEDGLDVYSIPQPFMSMLVYNQRANGWDGLRVREIRQALSMAVDKEVIVEQILRGNAEFSFTFQPQWSEWYDDSQVTEFGYQDTFGVDTAREQLEANLPSDHGYDGDTLVGPDGEQVTLTHVISEGSENTRTIAEYVGQQLEQLGFAHELEILQFNQLQNQYLVNSVPEDADPEYTTDSPFNAGDRDTATSAEPWDLNSGIAFNTYPFAPGSTDAFWTEQATTNYFGYIPSADTTTRYETLRTSPDRGEREAAFAEILGVLSEDQPVNFLSMSDDPVGYQDAVTGPVEEFAGNYDSAATFHFE